MKKPVDFLGTEILTPMEQNKLKGGLRKGEETEVEVEVEVETE